MLRLFYLKLLIIFVATPKFSLAYDSDAAELNDTISNIVGSKIGYVTDGTPGKSNDFWLSCHTDIGTSMSPECKQEWGEIKLDTKSKKHSQGILTVTKTGGYDAREYNMIYNKLDKSIDYVVSCIEPMDDRDSMFSVFKDKKCVPVTEEHCRNQSKRLKDHFKKWKACTSLEKDFDLIVPPCSSKITKIVEKSFDGECFKKRELRQESAMEKMADIGKVKAISQVADACRVAFPHVFKNVAPSAGKTGAQ